MNEQIIQQKHNGVTYHHIVLTDDDGIPKKYDGVLCFAQKDRLTLTGDFVLTLTDGSYKYGRQVQFRIRAPRSECALKHDTRHKSSWDTNDIYLPVEEIPAVIAGLQKLLEISRQNTP